MTTERFTKSDFETALDKALHGTGCRWSCIGIFAGEYRYTIRISDKVFANVNSSVMSDGRAADTAENSIRVWLIDHLGNSLGSKTQRWVTRVHGWEGRLEKTLDKTLRMGKAIQYCERCATIEKVFIVKKEGKNKGRLFTKCECADSFCWLEIDDDEQELPVTAAPAQTVVQEETPKCPRCSGRMVLRTRKSDGSKFWGCSSFPRCTGTRNYAEPVPLVVAETVMETVAVTPVSVDADSMAAVLRKAVDEVAAKPSGIVWSDMQNDFFDAIENILPGENIVLTAGAGSGKTTTIAEATRHIPADKKVVVLVYNHHNVAPVKAKVPKHIKVCTYHSLGNSACRSAWPNFILDEEGKKLQGAIESVLDKTTYRFLYPSVRKLVGLVKGNLSGTTDDELREIQEYHGIEVLGHSGLIFDTVRRVIARCAENTNFIDFDDQCWLPVVHNVLMEKYDYVFVDEGQDTNRNQAALALASVAPDGHIIVVGDENQSMYAFRGADSQAIPNLIEALDAKVLPLSISYRNPQCVVELVNQRFPEIPFFGTGKAGSISNMSYEQALVAYKPGDMVLCRTNAPLVAPVFELIRRGVKATIRGRNIGSGLASLVKKMKASTIDELLIKLEAYRQLEVARLLEAEKNIQAQGIADKVDTIIALSDGVLSIDALLQHIDAIFSDKVEGVVFSSIHRAKGLEAETVYILGPELMPHPMAKKDWEKIQERNIEYVALTRTLCNLIFVPQKS